MAVRMHFIGRINLLTKKLEISLCCWNLDHQNTTASDAICYIHILQSAGQALLKNWVLVLYGSSEAIDKADPISVSIPNRTQLNANTYLRAQESSSSANGSGHASPNPPPSATRAPPTAFTSKPEKSAKIKIQMGQANGQESAPPVRGKSQAASEVIKKGGGKFEKNQKESGNSPGKKKLPLTSKDSTTAAGKSSRKQEKNNSGGVTRATFRPKTAKKEQFLNELNRKAILKNSNSGKTIKAPKQAKENANSRNLYSSRTSTQSATDEAVAEPKPTTTTSPSTASTALQTRLSQLLFQKYDKIQQVYPEFHPYVPAINEAEKKASLFLAVPNPNNKKQMGDGTKSFRENGKMIFFSDPDFYPATTKPPQRTNTVFVNPQRNGRYTIWRK